MVWKKQQRAFQSHRRVLWFRGFWERQRSQWVFQAVFNRRFSSLRAVGSGGCAGTGFWITTPCPSATSGGVCRETSTLPTRDTTAGSSSLKVSGDILILIPRIPVCFHTLGEGRSIASFNIAETCNYHIFLLIDLKQIRQFFSALHTNPKKCTRSKGKNSTNVLQNQNNACFSKQTHKIAFVIHMFIQTISLTCLIW